MKINLIGEFTKIVTSIMLYGSCSNINFHLSYISNTQEGPPKYTKCYPQNFLEETSI